MMEACLCSNIFLFMRKLKEYFLLTYEYKQNEKSTSTFRGGIWEGNHLIVCVVLALDSWNYCSGEQAQ